jgi:hypothetical protein
VPAPVESARTGGSAMTLCDPKPIPIMEMETMARTTATLWRIDDFSPTSGGFWPETENEETFIKPDDRRREARHLWDLWSVGCEFTLCS